MEEGNKNLSHLKEVQDLLEASEIRNGPVFKYSVAVFIVRTVYSIEISCNALLFVDVSVD